MENKICNKCQSNEFYVSKNGKEKCKQCSRNSCKLYKERNKNKISLYNKEYKIKHRNEISVYNQKYNIENREQIQKRHTAYLKNRLATDPEFKFECSNRKRIYKLFRGIHKTNSSLELLACSSEILKLWLQYNFDDNMNLYNHGIYWHIDHVIPCAKYDISNEYEQKRCFNWTNLQPLNGNENMSKNDTTDLNEILNHIKKVIAFSKKYKIQLNEYSITNYSILLYLD